MTVRKLYATPSMPYHMALLTMDGRMMKFLAQPARKLEEKDLTPIPFYVAQGRNAEEAERHLYAAFGLEKAAGA